VPEERFDRQRRIPGWNQRVLEEARVAVVGDEDLLASLYVLSASALGLRNLVVVAPRLDPRLREIAGKLEPAPVIRFLEGFYTHPFVGDVFDGCGVIVDLSRYGLANKLLLEKGFRDGIPVVRGFCYERGDEQGLKVFTYIRGREWEDLRHLVSEANLPRGHFDDGALDIVAAGLALEETKNVLMGRRTSEETITYRRPRLKARGHVSKVCVVGAGALGNFAGLGLLYSGFRDVTFLDPDAADVTNLNRQVFLAGGVGLNKAEALAATLSGMFGAEVRGLGIRFGRDTDISGYDVVFDCVDNFETKIVLSETCRDWGRMLVSGGTGVEAGQVLVYDPGRPMETPAEALGLHEIVGEREIAARRREEASCVRSPDPSVIMTNQIVAGLMVDSLRMALSGREAGNVFYDASSDRRFSDRPGPQAASPPG
jgi:molybdopterin/thiamine biosynthesis adenylyltransferase